MKPMRFSRLVLILLGVVTGSFFIQAAAVNLSPWLTPLFHRPALAFATLFPG